MNSPHPEAVCDLSLQVASRIRALRLDRGWSKAHLAMLACVSPATVTAVEGGQRNVTLPFLEKVAGAFGEQPGVFFLPADDVCPQCGGRPWAGFTCNECGASANLHSNIPENSCPLYVP